MKKEYDALFCKTATNKFSLKYIDEVQAFYQRLDEEPSSGQLKVETKSLMSLIYFINNLPAQSFELDYESLVTVPSDSRGFENILGRATKTSLDLGKTDMVLPYALRYLKNTKDNFHTKLPILAWYIEVYPNGENGSFSSFEPVLSLIVSGMGAEIAPSLAFTDRVNYLYKEFKRAGKGLGAFGRAYNTLTVEQGEDLLTEYLAKEPLRFYRDTAKIYKQNKLNPPNRRRRDGL